MRIWPWAIGVSVLAHTVALAWVGTHKLEPLSEVRVAPPAEITITTVAPEPLAVALLDDHTVAMTPQLPAPPLTSTSHGTTARISTGHTTAATPEHAPSTTQEPPRSPFMAMRKPDRPDLKGPSDAFWRKFDENTKPPQPNAIAGERIADELHDATDNLENPRWVANHSGEEVAAERERMLALSEARDGHELQQKGRGYEAQHATFNGEVEPDGTMHVQEKRRYDPTEILMNKVGIDPYASNKRRMLDDTREERYEIGKRYKKEQLGKSAVLAQHNLEYLWAKTTDPAARKQGLFEMWDECAEQGDPEVVLAATSVRKLIIGFIRARKVTYSPDELAAFNAKKRSAATFAPFAD